MADYIRLSNSMPCSEDDLLFSDHIAISVATRRHQLDAIHRGIPAIPMACMPRSASATLTHSLAKLVDVPVLHTSIGMFPNYYLPPSWVGVFLEGGAITQDHIMANEFNCGVLRAMSVQDVFVLFRDPRAAARSFVHWTSRDDRQDLRSLDLRIRDECLNNFIPWLQSWIDCSRGHRIPARVHLLRFADVVGDLAGTVRRIAGILQDRFPAMAQYCDIDRLQEVRIHFNKGDDETWREEVSEATAKALWNACSPEIKELLQLTP
jgi:hypothetical protein